MKKKVFKMLPCIAGVGIAVFIGKKYYHSNVSEANSLLMQNVEALAKDGESQDDCHYLNGYTSFTGKKGGAYDCCKVWVTNAPKGEHCR